MCHLYIAQAILYDDFADMRYLCKESAGPEGFERGFRPEDALGGRLWPQHHYVHTLKISLKYTKKQLKHTEIHYM